MAEKILNAKTRQRSDTATNWASKNPVLKSGEIGVCVVPADTTAGTEQAFLIKIGDGATAWNSLPFISSLAGDVYSWAKASTKPTYTAEEVGALPSTTVIPTINGSSDANVTSTFIVEAGSYTNEQEETDGSITYQISIDKTFSNILSAVKKGYVPIITIDPNNSGIQTSLVFSGIDANEPIIFFEGKGIIENKWYQVTIAASGEAKLNIRHFGLLPDHANLENGKFLRLVNGAPAWVSLTNVAEEGA